MVDTNWGLVADDRVNDNLDFSQIHTQEDYDKAVRDFLKNTPDRYGNYKGRNILKARKRSPEDIIDEMYDESKAKDKVEEKQLKLREEEKSSLRKAQRLHAKRKPRGRKADERLTAKDTRRATKRTVKTWQRRRYRGLDIKGVDTKKRAKISRKNLISRGDMRLKNIVVSIDKRGVKHYHDTKTRKYVPNPFRKTK